MTDYDLQHYVPIPVVGADAVISLERPDLEIAVTWSGTDASPSGFNFVNGADYSAAITITAKTGALYQFNSGYAFSYPSGTVEIQPMDSMQQSTRLLSSVTYRATETGTLITETVELADDIPVPVTGEALTRSFGKTEYMGQVSWQVRNGTNWDDVHGSVFQPAAEYRADITLYAAPGYILPSTSTGFKYSLGGTLDAVTRMANTGSSVTGLTVTFPVTARQQISDLDFTGRRGTGRFRRCRLSPPSIRPAP